VAVDTQQEYDDTGKVVFDACYNQSDPRAYFTTLRDHDYRIAGEAQPVMRTVLDALRSCRDLDAVKVADLGASYGINAALLKTDLTLDDLNDHYTDPNVAGIGRDELLKRDRRFFREHETDSSLDTVGVDPAGNAVGYGVDAGLLDQVITTDLEKDPLGRDDAGTLSDIDMLISTGCVGYVTETSIEKLLDAASDHRPWMAHSVLRMFSFAPFIALLRDRGYVTERMDGTLLQRQFADDEEQAHVIENLRAMGIDPGGMESEGWYHANVYLSRPVEDARAAVELEIA
jgi:carnitine O-acetyltransferase